jgi:hypothetical protein
MLFRLVTSVTVCVILACSVYVFAEWSPLAFCAAMALALYLRYGDQNLSIGLGVVAVAVVIWAIYLIIPHPVARTQGPRRCCANIKCLAMALHSYHEANGCFPPAYIADKQGRPMHSWRTLLLPYVDGKKIYERYDFNEPWDGPNNRKLQSSMPGRWRDRWYACPEDERRDDSEPIYTNYLAVVGPDSAWRGTKALCQSDIAPTSNTVFLIEVADSNVIWTEPRDFDVAWLSSPTPPMTISSHHAPEKQFLRITPTAGANIALADSRAPFVPSEVLESRRLPDMLKVGGFTESDSDAITAPPPVDDARLHALVLWSLAVILLSWLALKARWREMRAAENAAVHDSSPPTSA